MTLHEYRHAEIALSGMRFHVRVGILPHERELPQPLEIDLRVRYLRSPSTVLDYRTLYALVSAIVESEPLEYLEAIGESVLRHALAVESALWARVTLRKPCVLLAGPLARAEVIVEGSNG